MYCNLRWCSIKNNASENANIKNYAYVHKYYVIDYNIEQISLWGMKSFIQTFSINHSKNLWISIDHWGILLLGINYYGNDVTPELFSPIKPDIFFGLHSYP